MNLLPMAMSDPQREEAFVDLVQAHQHQVMGYIYALVHNLHDTEDLYQQTVEILWAKFDQFDRTAHFGRWACGVARLEVANFRRRAHNRRVFHNPELMETLIDPATQQDAQQCSSFRDALDICKAKLAEPDQRLLRLYYSGEQTAKQIAEEHGRTLPGVYNALSRIRQALLQCIKLRLANEASL